MTGWQAFALVIGLAGFTIGAALLFTSLGDDE